MVKEWESAGSIKRHANAVPPGKSLNTGEKRGAVFPFLWLGTGIFPGDLADMAIERF